MNLTAELAKKLLEKKLQQAQVNDTRHKDIAKEFLAAIKDGNEEALADILKNLGSALNGENGNQSGYPHKDKG